MIFLALKNGYGSQLVIDGKDISGLVHSVVVEKTGAKGEVTVSMVFAPQATSIVTEGDSFRIAGVDCPPEVARALYEKLRERFEGLGIGAADAAERVCVP